ncbi:MAG TPA: EamA family transporter [Candidatus Angelobacter sp.]|nr:EamA family transporter [Candidatus Angelobacter sp.]
MAYSEKQHRFRVALAFALVYVLWGGTYLAMRVAVVELPPYVIGSVRFLIAGISMLVWCMLSGRKIMPSRQDLVRLLVVGVLLLSLANMGVLWAEKYVSSGLAALVVAVVPIWVAVLEAQVFHTRRLPLAGTLGLALGIVGMAVLLWPKIVSGTHLGQMELVGIGILIAACLGWALGSILSGNWTFSVDTLTSAAWEMMLAGIVNTVIAVATGGFHHATWTSRGIWSLIYLVTCGSWIGYTAYIWLLDHVPTPKVATYAYVNPVVAISFGWLLLDEKVDGFMLAGTVIIISAVVLVNRARLKTINPASVTCAEEPELTLAD